ncbi:MAG TPA: SDR family NAD(P)-dependent oxidoreductase, partial [Anaerolineae bacterium]|nr:SDR family NAD(P)-dependent oxidoreductase [Anaerolineae bacterium]
MDYAELAKMYDFTGRSVVITGGAGILGGEMACALVGCGASVALIDRDPAMAERLMHRFETSVGQAIVVYGDVLKPETLQQTAEKIIETFGRIDSLINAAGGNNPGATTNPNQSFFDLPPEALRFVFDLNLLGTILPSQIFGKYMVAQGEGV